MSIQLHWMQGGEVVSHIECGPEPSKNSNQKNYIMHIKRLREREGKKNKQTKVHIYHIFISNIPIKTSKPQKFKRPNKPQRTACCWEAARAGKARKWLVLLKLRHMVPHARSVSAGSGLHKLKEGFTSYASKPSTRTRFLCAGATELQQVTNNSLQWVPGYKSIIRLTEGATWCLSLRFWPQMKSSSTLAVCRQSWRPGCVLQNAESNSWSKMIAHALAYLYPQYRQE